VNAHVAPEFNYFMDLHGQRATQTYSRSLCAELLKPPEAESLVTF